jgi:hypothetical protein
MTELNVETVGLDAIQNTIDKMVEDIVQLGKIEIFEELTAWQSEDMHRKYPNTLQDTETSAVTGVWPRSRTWMPTRKTNRQVAQRIHMAQVHTSTRPILRAELFTMLCDRMAVLMSKVLQWQIKG